MRRPTSNKHSDGARTERLLCPCCASQSSRVSCDSPSPSAWVLGHLRRPIPSPMDADAFFVGVIVVADGAIPTGRGIFVSHDAKADDRARAAGREGRFRRTATCGGGAMRTGAGGSPAAYRSTKRHGERRAGAYLVHERVRGCSGGGLVPCLLGSDVSPHLLAHAPRIWLAFLPNDKASVVVSAQSQGMLVSCLVMPRYTCGSSQAIRPSCQTHAPHTRFPLVPSIQPCRKCCLEARVASGLVRSRLQHRSCPKRISGISGRLIRFRPERLT